MSTRAGSFERRPHSRIHRIFEQHRLAVSHQRALQKAEGLLAAAGDEHVVGIARDAFGARQLEQIAAQRGIAGGRSELQNGLRFLAVDDFFAGGAEFFDRKQQLGGARTREARQRALRRERPERTAGEPERTSRQLMRLGVARSAR